LSTADFVFFFVLVGVMHGVRAEGQALSVERTPGAPFAESLVPISFERSGVISEELPNAPEVQTSDAQSGRIISGTVTDINDAEVTGALITLSRKDSRSERTLATDASGFFSFGDAEAGTYIVTVAAVGFATWVSPEFELRDGESYIVPRIVLRVAVATTNVDVVFTQHDVAEEQMKIQEGQRVLGVFPNFYVSYTWDAAPLTAGQKFRLALRNEIDPVTFVGAAFQAGVEQWQNDYRDYGQGAEGYFIRFGAAYGDGFTSTMIAGAILPSILHQDPRYYYKGIGTVRSRTLYAISTVFKCKGDDGQWQPNYSNIFGNLAAAGISNAYYPAANRGAQLTIDNTLLGFASQAVGNLFQEFLIKKISTGVKKP
jgi:Carboxypeptidase regulatory-like domain